jgi:hypothetical protein
VNPEATGAPARRITRSRRPHESSRQHPGCGETAMVINTRGSSPPGIAAMSCVRLIPVALLERAAFTRGASVSLGTHLAVARTSTKRAGPPSSDASSARRSRCLREIDPRSRRSSGAGVRRRDSAMLAWAHERRSAPRVRECPRPVAASHGNAEASLSGNCGPGGPATGPLERLGFDGGGGYAGATFGRKERRDEHHLRRARG